MGLKLRIVELLRAIRSQYNVSNAFIHIDLVFGNEEAWTLYLGTLTIPLARLRVTDNGTIRAIDPVPTCSWEWVKRLQRLSHQYSIESPE